MKIKTLIEAARDAIPDYIARFSVRLSVLDQSASRADRARLNAYHTDASDLADAKARADAHAALAVAIAEVRAARSAHEAADIFLYNIARSILGETVMLIGFAGITILTSVLFVYIVHKYAIN